LADPTEPDHTPIWMTLRDAADALSIDGERHFIRALLRQTR
jgi:hypothetical protein